jgi:D-sedoheptulose 7-phosphate isomerase
MVGRSRLEDYLITLSELTRGTEVTDADGCGIALDDGIDWFIQQARRSHAAGNKIMFIGNGGSAAIASHLANDFCKNGRLRALAFNDAAAVTCLANDFGYTHVFAKQIELHAQRDDLLVAISSSGRSPNILHGVEAARARGCAIVTLSGFTAGNELRRTGDINFYLPSSEYGFAEIGHLTLCHAVLDLHRGWVGTRADAYATGEIALYAEPVPLCGPAIGEPEEMPTT